MLNCMRVCLIKTLSCAFIELFMKGGEDMALVYARLIIGGYRTFKSVPEVLKAKVKKTLEELECPELATEEDPKGNA